MFSEFGAVQGQVTLLDTFGSSGTGNGQFNQPLGLSVGPDGRLFVTDSLNNRVQTFTQAATSVTFAYTSQFGSSGSGNGQFNLPTDVGVSSSGTIYVSDSANNRVQYFNSAGVYQGQFGGLGTGNGQLDGPSSVSVVGTSVYVADTGNNRGQVFSTTGAYQSQFANSGGASQQVSLPAGIAVTASGIRYVSDTSGNRIQAYNADGSFLRSIGVGLLSTPIDLSVAPSGNLYVADSGNNRVRVFAPDGTFQFDLGVGMLNNPSDVTVAPTGQIFVSDTLNHQVVRWFNPSEWVSGFNTFNTPVAGSGQLLGQNLTLKTGMTLNSLTSLTIQNGGSLTVNGGTLNSTGTVSVAGTLTVAAGSTATSTGTVTIQSGGTLTGNGTLSAPVVVSGVIRPAEPGTGAVATLQTGNLTFAPGGRYDWSISQATGTAGSGFSQIAQSGTNSLTITSTSASPFTLKVSQVGLLADFDPHSSYSFPIASFNSISGFSSDKFTIDTSLFSNSLEGGNFSLSALNGTLYLNFNPVPEPGMMLAFAAVSLAAFRFARR
ncbi:MAG: hypothetical protein U0798_05175 [Gemmataceae bacterium]